MLELALVAALLVAATVAIHGVGTTYWLRFLAHRYGGHDGYYGLRGALGVVTWTALVLLALHLIEIALWAWAYLVLLPGDKFSSFEEAAYFSVVTFTTLGYGDITLSEHRWRLLSGLEALDGILLVGWTTALLFAVVQRSWMAMSHRRQA